MENIAVSVIVPVYNSEKFLAKALESTTVQGLDNIEVIIVNDGSTDDSEAVIDSFVESHPFAKKISQENQGVSAARNNAIAAAKGEYLAFLDSDDEFCENALFDMYSLAKKNDADMITGASVEITEFGETVYVNSEILSNKEYVDKADPSFAYSFSVCNKMFKRKIVIDNDLHFEKIKHAEDGLFLFSFLAHCNKIMGARRNVYKYYHRLSVSRKSAVKTLDSSKFEDVMYSIRSIEKITENWPDEFRKALIARSVKVTLINEYYRQLWRLDDKTLDTVVKEIEFRKTRVLPEDWEYLIRLSRDFELHKGLRTKSEIAEAPLISIVIPPGHTSDNVCIMTEGLYYQNCPDFEVICDSSYEAVVDESYVQMANFHFVNIDINDAANCLSVAKGKYTMIVDIPCLFQENYIGRFTKRMIIGGRTFMSCLPYAAFGEELLPIPEVAPSFGPDADKEKRKSDESRASFAQADIYLSNKMFDREKMCDLIRGEKLPLCKIMSEAYTKGTYKRNHDLNPVFFGEHIIQQHEIINLDSARITLVCEKGSADDISSETVTRLEVSSVADLFTNKSRMMQTMDSVKSEWVIFCLPGCSWTKESLDELAQFIMTRKEKAGTCVCRRIFTNDEKHVNDFVFKTGDRLIDLLEQPRSMVDSFSNIAIRTAAFRKTCAELKTDETDRYELLYKYLLNNTKVGVAASVSVHVSENETSDDFSFETCQKIFGKSIELYDKILTFVQHGALYYLKDSKDADERQRQEILSSCGEKVISASKYYSKDEKSRMIEIASGTDDHGNGSSGQAGSGGSGSGTGVTSGQGKTSGKGKSSAGRGLHYFTNLATAAAFIVVSRILSLFCKVRDDKVLFISDVREELGGNLLSVYDHLDEKYEKVSYLKRDRREWTPLGKWLRFVHDMTTSGTILLEDYFRYTSYYNVRSGQQICQLWHAAGAYKKFGYSRMNDGEGIRIHKGYKKYSKAITSAEAIIPNYAEAFGISEDKVKATGTPRTDIFFDEKYVSEARERMYEKYPVLRGRKVILFAPTYRGLRADDADYDIDALDLARLYHDLGGEYVFVFKWHPAMYSNILRKNTYSVNTELFGDFFLDLSGEPEINDLMLVSDVMITDYSSVIFDYYLLDKPVIFFAYDINEYADGRGWYYPASEYMYGPLARTHKELVWDIKNLSEDREVRSLFGKKFMDACDGNSTKKTCEWIFGDPKQ